MKMEPRDGGGYGSRSMEGGWMVMQWPEVEGEGSGGWRGEEFGAADGEGSDAAEEYCINIIIFPICVLIFLEKCISKSLAKFGCRSICC